MTKDRKAAPPERPVEQVSDQERRVSSLQRLTWPVASIAGLVSGWYVIVFLQTAAWQTLVVAALVLCVCVTFFIANRMARKGRVDDVSNLVIGVVLTLLPLSVLFQSNAALVIAPAALVLSVLVAALVWPRQRIVWAAGGGVLAAGLSLLFDRLVLWPRFDVTEGAFYKLFVYGGAGLTILIILWQIALFYQRITTIRVRLVATFVAVVLLVAAAVGAGAILVGLNGTRQQAFRQLESVAALKESEIDTWVHNLQLDLDAMLNEEYEVTRARTVLLWLELANPKDAQRTLRVRLQGMVDRARRFEEISMLNLQGEVVLSTDLTQEGKTYSRETWFLRGQEESYVHPPISFPSLAQPSVMVARPILDRYGDLVGVLVGRANLEQLNDIMSVRAGLGKSGETYLVGENHVLLTGSRFGQEYTYVHSPSIDNVIKSRASGADLYKDYRGVPVLGVYRWLPKLEVALLAEIGQREVAQASRQMVAINIGLALVSALFAVVVSVLFAGSISAPLVNLSDTATRIAAGEYNLEARVEREDEIGDLARAFNNMTIQLRELIGSLEQRVAERTRGLETVAEVTRATTSELDMTRLLPRVVELVRERFGLYYVGLFLVDGSQEYAVLRAGSGRAGQTMLAQGWRLSVGGESMIGQCVATGVYSIRQSEGDRAVRFDNPLLPDTRSELALPLRHGQRVIGAMSVQSVQEAAFDDTTIVVLQNMADQVAVAVQNARFFADAQEALDRAQEAQRRYQGQAWSKYLRGRSISGYERVAAQVAPLGYELLPEMQEVVSGQQETGRVLYREDGTILVPLVQGGRVLGALGFGAPEGRPVWSEEQVALLESLAEQLVQAAENQRLIDETQRRAVREQIIGEVAASVGATPDLDIVLQTAVREIGQRMGLRDVAIRLEMAAGEVQDADA